MFIIKKLIVKAINATFGTDPDIDILAALTGMPFPPHRRKIVLTNVDNFLIVDHLVIDILMVVLEMKIVSFLI